MVSQLLENKIDLAFQAIDAARVQAFSDKQQMPKCKETKEAFRTLESCLDLLQDL